MLKEDLPEPLRLSAVTSEREWRQSRRALRRPLVAALMSHKTHAESTPCASSSSAKPSWTVPRASSSGYGSAT